MKIGILLTGCYQLVVFSYIKYAVVDDLMLFQSAANKPYDFPGIFRIVVVIFFLILGFLLGRLYERKRFLSKDLGNSSSNEQLGDEDTELVKINYSTEEELRLLNATKDKFFSIIAHDLKNPFNSLLGFSDLLKNDFDMYEKKDIKKFINIMYESSKHGFNLLENLLQWSRSQTGRIAYIPNTVIINDVIKGCVNLLETSAHKKGIKIYKDIPETLETRGDIEMLSTVFRNLISNAIKFTPEGGRIKIKSRTTSRNVEVSVIDTGVGISEEKINSLFRIEKQVSTFGTNNEKGTGLGLILCKEFIDKHGGKIKVRSERKNGSEFKVILPLQNFNKQANVKDRFKNKAIQRNECHINP